MSPDPLHLETELLSGYLDDHLSTAERARVESHLQGCGECEARLAGLRRSVASLRALERVAPPAELLVRLRQGVGGHPHREPIAVGPRAWLRWPILRPAFAAAAVAILAAVVGLTYFALGTPETPPGPTVVDLQAQRAASPAPRAAAGPIRSQPVVLPEAIPAAPAPVAPPPERAARGVAGGVSGGVEGGAPGGIPGGTVGGVAGGVASPPAAPQPAAAPVQAAEVPEREAAREALSAAPSAQSGDVRRDRPALSKAEAQGAAADELAAGGRRFVRDARGWREAGIAEDALPSRSIPLDSATGRALLVRLGDLRRRLGPGDRLLLYDGGRVIELRGPAAPEPR